MDAVDRNLRDSIGSDFPRTRGKAIIDAFFLWEPRIRSVDVSDLTSGFNFISVLQRHAGVPPEVPWPNVWVERLKATNKLRVYNITCVVGRIEVVCCFLTPVKVAPESGPEVVSPGIEHIQLVEKIYDQWRSGHRLSAPAVTFFTFGTMGSWEDGVRHRVTSGRKILHFYKLSPNRISETIEPRLDAETKSFRDFRDQLKPETVNERLARLRQMIRDHEDRRKNADGGNLDLETIAQRTGYRPSAVESLCFRLQRERGYQVY